MSKVILFNFDEDIVDSDEVTRAKFDVNLRGNCQKAGSEVSYGNSHDKISNNVKIFNTGMSKVILFKLDGEIVHRWAIKFDVNPLKA